MASELTPSEHICQKWVTDLEARVAWSKNASNLTCIRSDESNVSCLVISKPLASALTKALCLGREYDWQTTQEKKYGQYNESKRIDGKVLLQSLHFRIKLKKSEIKRAGNPSPQQMSDLEHLFRKEAQLEGEMAAISRADATYATVMEQTRESWCAAWLEVDTMLKSAWWEVGILRREPEFYEDNDAADSGARKSQHSDNALVPANPPKLQDEDEESRIPTEIFDLECLRQAQKKRPVIEDWLRNGKSNQGGFDPLQPATLPLTEETRGQALEPQGSDSARKNELDMLLGRLGKEAYEQRGVFEIQREVQDDKIESTGRTEEVFAIAPHSSQVPSVQVDELPQNGGDSTSIQTHENPNVHGKAVEIEHVRDFEPEEQAATSSAGAKRKRGLSHQSVSQSKRSKSGKSVEYSEKPGENELAIASAMPPPEDATRDPATTEQPLKGRFRNHKKNNMQ